MTGGEVVKEADGGRLTAATPAVLPARPLFSLEKQQGGYPARKGPDMNFMLIMKNEQSGLVAIGPLAVEYQAAMLRDEIENSSGWTSVGIARVLTEAQARELTAAAQP
jgi:hypothetical protein